MNRFHEMKPCDLHALAGEMKIRGRRRLRLDAACVRRLKRRLDALALQQDEDEALRRMKGDAGLVLTRMQAAAERRGIPLPAPGRVPRALILARALLDGGEVRPDTKRLEEQIIAFDTVQEMEMLELQCIPEALEIALCEALDHLAGEILRGCHWRSIARNWVRSGGRRMLPRRADAAFWVHALQLCSEEELPQLHARVWRAIERRGMKAEHLLEQVQRSSADCCLRLDNLMHVRRLLQGLRWEESFARISPAEQELLSDPGEIYARMDAPGRGCIREYTAQLARCMKVSEIAAVRYAVRLAQQARSEHGPQDPRATVCWYLAEDKGRAALRRELGGGRRLPKCVPDPDGRGCTALVGGVTILLCVLLAWIMDEILLAAYALPLAWELGQQLIHRVYPRFVRPMRILKLEMKTVPDCARTLVVLPVLLSSEARAREMTGRMEALGCLERDVNIDYLLLGDFRDADAEHLEEDETILNAAREGIAALNSRGRKKYYYLHRGRSLRPMDGRWMGENRKRGALTALNRLLLNRSDAALAFSAEHTEAAELAGRYRYVVTLDADTEYLPGTLQRLIGAMLHPLNRACMVDGRRRGYAVLQPRMQLLADACENAYARLCHGDGGMDSYPVHLSDFYQDLCGRGCFAGKGIYDVRAFTERTEILPHDDSILSHDLIEGVFSGAGSLGDVCFFDSCPRDRSADLARLHRWTRGDWQLLPILFSRESIAAVDRMKLLGNLLRSLYAPALLSLLIHAMWINAPLAFLLGLTLAFREALADFRFAAWKQALFRLANLPSEAACMLDAILRTLWRLTVTKKHLMDWVTAADARAGRQSRLWGQIAAILLLPGLLNAVWIPAVVALGLLFLAGPAWADELASARPGRQLGMEQKDFLMDLARRTWRFFEETVPHGGCGLPPDNVQLDPPAGTAMRTSPTNIGLYLMSCLSALHLGFIGREELLRRMQESICTLEKLEKWNGQLYNWYDLRTLAPLRPRYVSAVDSGNLAGALLLCAHALENHPLRARIRALLEEMNLASLYDAERKLFFIGMDVDSDRMSQAHYDLYASEARILSFSAMMLGQADVSHWQHLSRACVRRGRHQALLSWSGTMFEYLMPDLLFACPENTLAGKSRQEMLACQMALGRELKRPWGVSESGYYAFDLQLNYQYRAFGLRALALSPHAAQDVVAPYASALALMAEPDAAVQNLRQLCALGLFGELGMYEAADYQHIGDRPRIVRSHMAHHQGMTLCAICNALREDVLRRSFMEIPQARALRILLQEKPGVRARIRRKPAPVKPETESRRADAAFRRRGRREERSADTHLLHACGATALVTARGAVFAWKDGWQLNRFFGDLTDMHQGMFVHLRDLDTGECAVFGEGACILDAGYARFGCELGGVQAELTITISPEDGAVYQHISLRCDLRAHRIEITGCFAAALCPEKDMRAHPVFQNLFVSSRREGNALIFRRKRREPGDPWPQMVYLLSGAEISEYETDLEKLAGRTGSLGRAGGISAAFSGSEGDTLNPCAAIRCRIELKPHREQTLHFALNLAEEGKLRECTGRMEAADAPRRALQLAVPQTRAVLQHAGVDDQGFRLLQRAAALILDPRLRRDSGQGDAPWAPAQRSDLWRAGISSDLPILLVELQEEARLDCVRQALHAHAFYRMMGVKMDFVLIDLHGSDYLHSSRAALCDLITSSHLGGSVAAPGGGYILEVDNLDASSLEIIRRAAVLRFDGAQSFASQLRVQLDGLNLHLPHRIEPMAAGRMEMDQQDLCFYNGYGGFGEEGYVISVGEQQLPPAPWSNLIAGEEAGMLVTERGGGYAWKGNSRSDRLTEFANDPLREGWGWMFYLLDEAENRWLRLLPGDKPMADFRVSHAPGRSSFAACTDTLAFEVTMHAMDAGVRMDVTLENRGEGVRHLRLAGLVDWIMGTDAGDSCMLRCWSRQGACFASGTAKMVGVFACDDPRARTGCDRNTLYNGGDMMHPLGLDRIEYSRGGWTLHLPLVLRRGERRCCRFLLGGAQSIREAEKLARDFRSGEALRRNTDDWDARLKMLQIFTPDPAVNLLCGGFLQAQILNARIRGRTGLYQGGGAYGFRDQLQDMLPMIHYEPGRVRQHLIDCAARQFEAGDVLHWWHPPYTGVRTRISDDLLFLPYVTAQYVSITGDASVLDERVPFLKEMEIPDGREDIYAEMQPGDAIASLHEHCMRAIRRAAQTGQHGLCRMGSGDWNDGMNRVGDRGRGESIWLSQFLLICARDYGQICPAEADRIDLKKIERRLKDAIEENGWDGAWYLRAFGDEGEKLGSHANACCRIDLISQAFSVLAQLDSNRSRSAMNAAWEQLADERLGVIRLLTPPFDGKDLDPGYIAAYPPGVRENGAQYTHAACWMLIALIRQGDAVRAHRALQMLLPVNHARTRKDAEIYRAEPYVMAADIYTHPDHPGRGGWSWYTGSAAWMLQAVLSLLGYERRGSRVRLHALLGEWEEAGVRLQWGRAGYTLICRRDVRKLTLDGEEIGGDFITLSDDGREHIALFPARRMHHE